MLDVKELKSYFKLDCIKNGIKENDIMNVLIMWIKWILKNLKFHLCKKRN